MTETTALVPSLNIERFIDSQSAVLDLVSQAAALLDQAQELAEHIGLDQAMESLGPNASRFCSHQANLLKPEGVDDFKKFLDALAWDKILKESGIRTFMDNKSRRTWDEQIQHCNVPELTLEAVRQNIKQWLDNRPEMMEAGVVEVFRNLSYDYRTNTPRMFGKKIIVTGFCTKWVHRNNGVQTTDLHIELPACNKLDDLVRVMTVLDGKPEPDHRRGVWRLVKDARNEDEGTMTLETEYLELRWYLKGTVHVKFKRKDLVARMNQILGKHHPNALPPVSKC